MPRGAGRIFSNTIILLTSNPRCPLPVRADSPRWVWHCRRPRPPAAANRRYRKPRSFSGPELMGRLDETVLFDPLGPEQLAGIADRLLSSLSIRAAGQGICLPIPSAAKGAGRGQGAALRCAGAAPHRQPCRGAGPCGPHRCRYSPPRHRLHRRCGRRRAYYPDRGYNGGVCVA